MASPSLWLKNVAELILGLTYKHYVCTKWEPKEPYATSSHAKVEMYKNKLRVRICAPVSKL